VQVGVVEEVAAAQRLLGRREGEGPHGSLLVLRLCGFPERGTDSLGTAALERTVFGARTFFLRQRLGAT
jgi:hypothetical protein